MTYKYVVKKNLSFEEAEKKFRKAIEEAGLKVVGEVMPSEKIKKGLGIEIPPYKVLLICHAKYMHDMMQMNYDIGTLAPCHGIVYVKDNETYVGVDIPSEKLKAAGKEIVEYIKKTDEMMRKAVDLVE